MPTYDKYRTILETLLEQVTTELETIARYNEETGDWEAVVDANTQAESDSNSEADAAEELDVRNATVVEIETQYRNIKRALDKFSAGTFGLCEISHEPIELARLDILPSARTCIAHREEERTLPL